MARRKKRSLLKWAVVLSLAVIVYIKATGGLRLFEK